MELDEITIPDGVDGYLYASADEDYMTISIHDDTAFSSACICLSLEQVRELAGWMRQIMAKMKEAAK